jgi:2-polyprenyl-3-methyl-5-hydroxy-6-metoxy-1,4-benzoquinol methylase
MEYSNVQNILSDKFIKEFIVSSLRESMANIGFSETLINDFLIKLDNLDVENFINDHRNELADIQLGNFFGNLVPQYFKDYIVPEIPTGGKVFDLGCGRGTLIKILAELGKNEEIVGVDIKEAAEWKDIQSPHVRLSVVQEPDFLSVLEKEQPGTVTITWVLHHMDFEQQKRYINQLFKALKNGARLVVLEDSYSTILRPELGNGRYEGFIKWGQEDRNKITGVLDWIANRIFSMRTTMPVPFAYRTLEEWGSIFEEAGFTVSKTRFLGFPDKRDVNTPQGVIVLFK